MLPFLSTARLYLREPTLADAPCFFELDHDPAVMRYVGGVDPTSDAAANRERLAKMIARYEPLAGLGLGVCCLEADHTFIGWFCLKPCLIAFSRDGGGWLEPSEHIEVGYRLAQRFWGYGYATEMARALVQYGFERLALKEIVGTADPEHRASQHVLEKVGLQYRGRAWYFESDVAVYGAAR